MPSITSGFLRAPSKCWYPCGRCSTLWSERCSCGNLRGIKSKHADTKNTSRKKLLFLAILPPLVRRVNEAQAQPVEIVQKPSSEPETTRRDNDAIYDADDPEGVRKGQAWRHARRQSATGHDKVQRIPAEGGRAAGARWASPALDGRARLFLRWPREGDVRALR